MPPLLSSGCLILRCRYAHVQLLEPENACLAFHLHQGSRAPAPASVLPRLSRVLEERVAVAEGVQDVRHWLQLIGHGEEYEWINLGTVAGYRRAVFCQSVRDDVDANVGPGCWAQCLPRMCEGRLVPTPWLNKVRLAPGREGASELPPHPPPPPLRHRPNHTQNFREPLYLLDTPVRVEDTRNEEERKYPELFRAKLEGAPALLSLSRGRVVGGKLRHNQLSCPCPLMPCS